MGRDTGAIYIACHTTGRFPILHHLASWSEQDASDIGFHSFDFVPPSYRDFGNIADRCNDKSCCDT